MPLDPITTGLNAASEALKLAQKLTPTQEEKEQQEIRKEHEQNCKIIDANHAAALERMRNGEDKSGAGGAGSGDAPVDGGAGGD